MKIRDNPWEMRPIARLKRYPTNPRTHSPDQISKIAASIREFGFAAPILITDDGTIVAGHGRLEAAKIIGMSEVPTIIVGADWSPDQLRAYVIADNQLALMAGWDNDLLRAEIAALAESNFDLDFIGLASLEALDHDQAATAPVLGDMQYQVIVTVDGEMQQASLVSRLEREGYACRVLIL